MHSLLRRQIKRLVDTMDLPAALSPLLAAISETYQQADIDRVMIERSLDIASQEMLAQNRVLADELELRRAAESQLEHLTNYDALTGLVNRNLLNDRIAQALASGHRHSKKFAVLALGLDHFRAINDTLGQRVGNELLLLIAERLRGCVRGGDTLARIGGDDFVLVLVEMSDDNVNPNALPRVADMTLFDSFLVEILRRILRTVSKTIDLAGQELQISCSIGLSLYPQDGGDVETLLRHANAAMTSAKQLGRNNFQFYTMDLGARIGEKLTLQAKLRHALEREEFVLHYQPQVDLRTGCVVGMEALIRWNQPEIGMVPPLQFIGLAEESGLILPIGAWVVRTACAQAKAWQEAGCGHYRIAINLSVRQFSQPDLVQFIESVLAETELDPSCLEIELTESLVMTDVEQSISILRDLKAPGLKLSIDDFGTGYSSLSYLKRFPIDVLKIDQSFVRDIDAVDDAAIVKAIISMAHSLGIRVIAEGVETEAQCEFLRANLCDEIQGFFFSKGLSENEAERLLRDGRRLPDHLLHLSRRMRTLLLVDDEANIVAALKRLLRQDHYHILTANSGQEGLDILAQHPVDVIVSDQRMPGMSGVEFLREAKSRFPDTVRIVLSGYTELQSVTDAVNEGAIYKFLTKPWDDAKLRAHIQEAFQRKEMADENQRLNMEIRTANQSMATANRRLEEVLSQQQQQIISGEVSLDIVREVLQHVPLPVIGLDDDNVIAFANDAAQTLFNGTAAILGSDARQLMPELCHATAGEDARFTVELNGILFQVISSSMGHGSLSRGKLMTLSRCGGQA